MALSLSNLASVKQSKKKRRGRGDSSGRGTYSTRGQKGQRSRSGGKRKLKRKGLKQFLQQIPKSRGFKSFYPANCVVNIGVLEKKFASGELITLNKMVKAGILKLRKGKVKILGKGELKKKFTVQAHSFSKTAQQAIEKAGGKTELIK